MITKKDLILTEDTTFNESIKVRGNIKGDYNLKVLGNIDCRNIDCGNIDCLNIDCLNIDCWNIDCLNIDCWNINCLNINCLNINCLNIYCLNIYCRNIDCGNIVLCNKFKSTGKVKAKSIIKDRFNIKQKEFSKDGDLK